KLPCPLSYKTKRKSETGKNLARDDDVQNIKQNLAGQRDDPHSNQAIPEKQKERAAEVSDNERYHANLVRKVKPLKTLHEPRKHVEDNARRDADPDDKHQFFEGVPVCRRDREKMVCTARQQNRNGDKHCRNRTEINQ